MSMSEHNAAQVGGIVGQPVGQPERKLSQIDVAFEIMAKEVAAIYAVVDQLIVKLEPVRIPGQYPERETDECPRQSPVVTRLHELTLALLGQRERLEHLSEEIQL